MLNRFIRAYRLTIEVKSKADGGESNSSTIDIQSNGGSDEPLRISFTGYKSTQGSNGASRLSLKIYNLNETNRNLIAKDPVYNYKDIDGRDIKKDITVRLSVGYMNNFKQIFKGKVHSCTNKRAGADFITDIETQSAEALQETIINGVYRGRKEVLNLVSNLTGLKLGRFSSEIKEPLRPIVMMGLISDALPDIVADDEMCFVDDEMIHFIKKKESTLETIVTVNSETGLLNTPERQSTFIVIDTMMNPDITISNKIKLESNAAKYMNGLYQVDSIEYLGDSHSNEWKQKVYAKIVKDKK